MKYIMNNIYMRTLSKYYIYEDIYEDIYEIYYELYYELYL